MTARLAGVDAAAWHELLGALEGAVRDGSRRPLARLAAREDLPSDGALRELATLPAGAAAAGPAVTALVRALAERWLRPLPAAPFVDLAGLAAPLEDLLERAGRPGDPGRARTAPDVLRAALARGGPLGATGAYLTGPELEQVAAFVPPGSGRGDPRLAPVEAWIRRAVSHEAAVVEL